MQWSRAVPATRGTASPGTKGFPVRAGDDMVTEVKLRVGEELERLSHSLMQEMEASLARIGDDAAVSAERRALQEEIRFLGQVTAGLVEADPADITMDRAGFGSTIEAENLDTGTMVSYTLMVGDLIDIDAGQVSLASPIGQGLLGRAPGDLVEVELPQRWLRLRVRSVRTLPERLGLVRGSGRRKRHAFA